MTKNNNDISVTGWMWIGILGLAVATAFFKTGSTVSSSAHSNNGATYTGSAPLGVDRNSFEHRYAKERVKLEGYSDREAEQAADAIIKFHNAQQNK